MKEIDKQGIAQDVGKLEQGVSDSTNYNPHESGKFFLPVGGGPNKGHHPAKQQSDTLRYMRPE